MVTPFRIQKFLRGLRYPVRKADAMEHARALGADVPLLTALEALDAGAAYESPVALSRALSREQRVQLPRVPEGKRAPTQDKA